MSSPGACWSAAPGPLYLASGLHRPRPKNGDPHHPSENYYIQARELRNAVKIGVAFDVMGAELRDEAPNEPDWVRNNYTRRDYQQTHHWDKYDVPLRFRTGGPHLRWPETGPSSNGEMPTVRAFSAVENPAGLAIRVLPVRDVVAAMPGAVAELFPEDIGDDPAEEETRRRFAARALILLARTPLHIFGKRNEKTLLSTSGHNSTDQAIVKRLDGVTPDPEVFDTDEILNADWGLRWDPNRMLISKLDPAANVGIMQAIAVVIHSVNNAMRDASIPIVLRRGDALFLDNLRVLAGRFEHDYTQVDFWKRVVNVRPEWWLRSYYGFRYPQAGSFVRETVGPQFRQEPAPAPQGAAQHEAHQNASSV